MHRTHRIFNTHKLLAVCLQIKLCATKTWQDQGFITSDQMRTVQLGGNLHGHLAAIQTMSGICSVGRCRKKISTQSEKDFDLACVHRFDRFDCAVPMSMRRSETELCTKSMQKIA